MAAFITFGFTFWFALQLLFPRITQHEKNNLGGWIRFTLGLVMLQITYGAFVAGLHAGRIANTFPTMDGEWIPSGINSMSPAWMNFSENLLAVQFIHRCIACVLLVLISAMWLAARRKSID